MPFLIDPAKNRLNLDKHGLALSDFDGFDSDGSTVTIVDERQDYGEVRYQTFGRINGTGFMVVTAASQLGTRLISFRRAREKELRRYDL